MNNKSAMVTAALLLAGVATANAQQDTAKAGQRQQAASDTSARQQGDSIKQWGRDSATPSGKKGNREQDAVSKKNAAGQSSDSTARTGTPKTRSDSVSSQNPSGAQRQQSSNNEWKATPDSARRGRDSSSSSSYSNPSSPSGSTTTTPSTTSSTTPSTALSNASSRKMTKDEIRSERETWFRGAGEVAKDQELSKNASAPGAGASQQSSTATDASQQQSPSSQQKSGVDASVQRSPEQSPQDARQHPSTTSGNHQSPQAEYTDSTRRYVPRDSTSSSSGSYSTPSSSSTSQQSSSTTTSAASSDKAPRGDVTNATDPQALNPTGTGNNQGSNPESTRPEKMSSSTTGQQANASNRAENKDNATTKDEVGGAKKNK